MKKATLDKLVKAGLVVDEEMLLASGVCPCGSATSDGCSQTGCPLYLYSEKTEPNKAETGENTSAVRTVDHDPLVITDEDLCVGFQLEESEWMKRFRIAGENGFYDTGDEGGTPITYEGTAFVCGMDYQRKEDARGIEVLEAKNRHLERELKTIRLVLANTEAEVTRLRDVLLFIEAGGYEADMLETLRVCREAARDALDGMIE
jgi:hypothetical protein